jgi:hypothetical protein
MEAIQTTDPARAAAMRALIAKLHKDDARRTIDATGTHVQHHDSIDAYRFRKALYGNLTGGEINADEIAMARLAHLYSATLAELELRKRAATDADAKTLLTQLDQMKACERGIL